ncbi:MAG: ArsR/SmtB family transcription factor [Oscillospiraceae bacterium]
MDYAFIRKPYILFETVEMLYRFVNGISFRSLLSLRLAAEDTAEGDRMVRQVEQLQEILEETCRGLDPQSPALRRFFARVDTSDKQEGTCLARLLTFSFFTLKETDFWKNVEEIRTNWRYLQEKGAWIQSYSIMSLEFSFGEDCPGDFLDQVCALELPPEFQLNLCRALRSFDKSLDELANLIYPIAQRLEETLHRAHWILDQRVEYWQNSPVPLLDYLSDTMGQTLTVGEHEHTVVAIFVMNYNFLLYKKSDLLENESYLYLGCGVSVKSQRRDQNMTYEMLGLSLKALSDKKRLEILGRLSKERAYSLELAKAMGVDPSNMSRNLALLCSYGFLKQEQEAQKNYYQTDHEAVRHFLRQLERVLLT